MPPKRAVESGECILTIGKFNNVVAWNARMVDVVGKLFGDTANFLTTNERHEIPFPIESDYIPVVPAAIEGGPVPMAITAALITKLREENLVHYVGMYVPRITKQGSRGTRIRCSGTIT